MSAHAYSEDQQAWRSLTRPLPPGEEADEQPQSHALLSGQIAFRVQTGLS